MLSNSPSKGKAKEHEGHLNWEIGFWDLYPLVQRPILWTRSSIIFTAHAQQPLVVARFFSTSKQFIIPAPNPPSGASYGPPTVIETTPDETWLFAYFPGVQSDGLGCFWKRGLAADIWNLKDKCLFARGAGAVAASWVSDDRQWITSQSGIPTRLPPRGPPTPMSSPTLLIVTQSHEIKVGHFRPGSDTLQMVAGALLEPSGPEPPSRPPQDIPVGPGGTKLCTHAAVGMGYNGNIVIAMRSTLYPPFNTTLYNPTEPVDASSQPLPSASPLEASLEWETWGEETSIELCQVTLGFNKTRLTLSTSPVPPIQHAAHLCQLAFVPEPPAPATTAIPDMVSPAKTPKSPTKSPKLTRSPSISRKKDGKATFAVVLPTPGKLYLAANFLNFGNYSSTPSSEISLYSLSRDPTTSTTVHHEATREFTSAVTTFMNPRVLQDPIRGALQVGLIEAKGSVPKRTPRPKDVQIGAVSLLNLPDLSDNTDWFKSVIICASESLAVDLPLNGTVSPNSLMMCTASSSLAATQMRVQPAPRRHIANPTPENKSLGPRYLGHLVSAVHNRCSTADLTFLMSLGSCPPQEAVATFEAALALNSEDSSWIREVLGVVVEYYRLRSRHCPVKVDKDRVELRLQTAHDICSLVACNNAFNACREGLEGYDHEAVWKLISLSSWAVTFVEKVMKSCVLCGDVGVEPVQDDLFGSGPPSPEFQPPVLDSPTLLHLVHPFALKHLRSVLQHVQRYRKFLGGRTPRGENAQIERNVLIDLVDYSGFDVAPLLDLLDDFLDGAEAIDGQTRRRALAQCQPDLTMDKQLRHVIRTLMASPVINKARLFIKPSELVDGIMHGMSFDGRQTKLADKDVILKGALLNRPAAAPSASRLSVARASGMLKAHVHARLSCLRCGGRTDVGQNLTTHGKHWNAWERNWTMRCVCGGFWGA